MKKKGNLMILRAAEVLLSLVIATALFWGTADEESGLILSSGIAWLPSVLASVVFLLLLLEFFRSRPWVRAVYLAIVLLTLLLSINEGLAFVNAAVWLFFTVYAVLALVALIRTKRGSEKEPENRAEKTYSLGFFSKRQSVLSISSTVLFVLLIGALTILFLHYSYPVPLFAFLIFLVLFAYLCCMFFTISKETPSAVLKRFNRDCRYEELKRSLEKMLSRPLHPDDRSYVEILLTSACSLVDLEETKQRFSTIVRPSQKNYRILYDMLRIDLMLTDKMAEEAENAICRFQETYPRNKNGEYLNRARLILTTEEAILSVETYYPVNTKNPYLNIVNANMLLNYYRVRKNWEKARIYAEKILNQPSDFTELRAFAEKFVNGESVENPEA